MYRTGHSEGSGTAAPVQTPQAVEAVVSKVADLSPEEQAFELRSSILEVETLIKHLQNSGLDTSELYEEKSGMEQQLQELTASTQIADTSAGEMGANLVLNEFKATANLSDLTSIKRSPSPVTK